MASNGFPTAAELAAATPDEIRAAVAKAGDALGPARAVVEDLALDNARLRAELKQATRAREVLLSSIAHDLRNPLNTFAMSAGLLRDDLESPDLDRTRALSLMTRMDRATTRMQGLIEDLLEASRVQSGIIEVASKLENAAAVARAAIAKAKPLVTDKGATIDEGPIDDDIVATLDRARTVDGLVRLVAVALRSTGEGGAIAIGAESIDGATSFTVRASAPRSKTSVAPPDEAKGGLPYFIARGLFALQNARIGVESTPEGPRAIVSFDR